jgi:branched-chain amino acid transport system permease protein
VVVGGTGSLVGAFAGAGLIVATRDWLAGPWPGHAPLLVGALLIVAVYAFPDGVAGLRRVRWVS